jgi:hypothetical protein
VSGVDNEHDGASLVEGGEREGDKAKSVRGLCHTRFLSLKPDAHRMYAQDQVVLHTVKM